MWNCKSGKCTGMSAGLMFVVFMPVWIVLVTNSGSENQSDARMSLVSMTEPNEEKKMLTKDVLGYEMKMIDGTMQSLEAYRGKVIMMVNVASACGLTPQYEGLEALYRKHQKDGLVIIGFPANEFGAQEPGTNEEIAEFCSTKFDVTFPMTAKIKVKGEGVHPLYKQLAAQPEPVGGEPEWNFDKFIVNRQGEVVARFKPRTTPEDPALLEKIGELLSDK
jgi:glutathione peroxidase